MNVVSKVLIIVFFLTTIKIHAFNFYFKYPFANVNQFTSNIINYASKDRNEITTHFTHKNEIWRVENHSYRGNRKSLNGFSVYDGMNYEKYNHKKAKIEIGVITKKDRYSASILVKNSQGEQIGLANYIFNELGYVLSVSKHYFNLTAQKEIQNINYRFKYNCFNQMIYYSVFYTYFNSSYKYKRKKDEEYIVINCNPDLKGNYRHLYFSSAIDGAILKFETREFTYK